MKKRRLLAVILSLCLILCTLAGMTTTVAGAVVHVHSLTHIEAQGATCTADGNSEYWICTECGKYFSDSGATREISQSDTVLSAKGHSYVDTVTEPTCTEQGYTTHKCSVCNYSYVDTYTTALGHSYESVVTAPTCTETGYTTYTCSVCGDTYTADETAALGHSYVAVVTDPTCTEEGYTTHTCSECGDNYVDTYTSALGHKHELSGFTWANDLKTATAEFVCSTCGNSETVAATITGEGHLGVSVHTATVLFNGETYSVSVTTGTTVTIPSATTQTDSEEVTVDTPVEDSTTESEPEEPEETPTETNPTTGMVVALLPMAIAVAGAIWGKPLSRG